MEEFLYGKTDVKLYDSYLTTLRVQNTVGETDMIRQHVSSTRQEAENHMQMLLQRLCAAYVKTGFSVAATPRFESLDSHEHVLSYIGMTVVATDLIEAGDAALITITVVGQANDACNSNPTNGAD